MWGMKLPYGIADFPLLRREGYVYIDRTDRIPILEELGRSLLFVRPRRFGKSLLINTLGTYYDLRFESEHEALFGDLAIGREPTPSAHDYFVLKWNFSKIDPLGGSASDPVKGIAADLDDYVNSTVEAFSSDYRNELAEYLEAPIRIEKSARHTFENLLAAIRRTPHKLCLLIDEYDNFANEILIGDEPTYHRLVHADGPFKSLMKQVKAATEGAGVERLFFTGVTPLVLSDLTSGINMAKSISLEESLSSLCGFTEAEVRVLLERIAELRGGDISVDEAQAMMRTWYNGYSFAPEAPPEVYNPTLAIYFLEYLRRKGSYPRQMLDANLAADENKLRFLGREAGGGDVLAELVQTGEPLEVERIEDHFTLSEMLTQARQAKTIVGSFLFYFGMLTIVGETPKRTLQLGLPNLVVRKLYIEQTLRQLLAEERESPDLAGPAWELMEHGKIEPLLELIEEKLFPCFSARDKRWLNELAVKTAFATLLFQDLNYRLFSEPSIDGAAPLGKGHGYADLVLLLRPDARSTPLYDLLLEFKWVRPEELGMDVEELEVMERSVLAAAPPVAAALEKATTQARRYRAGLVARYGETLKLRCWAVVAVGLKRLVAREVP
jgi:hypothetical protein